jgi:hypothetical protein
MLLALFLNGLSLRAEFLLAALPESAGLLVAGVGLAVAATSIRRLLKRIESR